MFFLTVASLALPLLSAAQGSYKPTSPGPGDVFKEGAQCPITWDADTTGKWKVTNIELMTGSNQQMVHLSTVATVDGTDPTKTSVSIPCPSVTPNSAIYFYQFTAQDQNATWTGRFAISDTTGATTLPPNASQPDGSAIPWGTGNLIGTAGTPPPSTAPANQIDGSGAAGAGAANGTNSSSTSSSTSSSSTQSSVASTPSSSPVVSAASPTGLAGTSTVATTLKAAAATSSSAAPSTSTNGAVANSFSATLAFTAAAAILGITGLC